MTFQGDPHRTLGVAPGASLNEIKSAYRRLVKKYHPDAAGERALPRFLAIQEAYERLVDPEGRLRPTPAPGRARPAPSQAWRADPARARASRDAWRARRSGAAAAGAASSGSRTRPGTQGGPASGTTGGQGGSNAGGPADGQGGSTRRERPHREHHARRGPRKATPGSTTYDEAAETPLDPEWDGGAWYGPTTGTYWTINPREYADPRKHGPEYQARARRAAQAQRLGFSDDLAPGRAPGPSPETDAAGESLRWRWTSADGTQTGGGAEWGTGDWRYDEAADPTARAAGPSRAAGSRPGTAAPDAPRDLEAAARLASPASLLALARRDRRWLAALALAGWPPIGWAAGTLAAQATACAPASPDCAPVLQLVPVAVQVVVVAALYLVPPAAAVAAFASLVALAVALPVAAVRSLAGEDAASSAGPVLGVAVAVAYLTALAIAARTAWRTPDGTGPPPPAP